MKYAAAATYAPRKQGARATKLITSIKVHSYLLNLVIPFLDFVEIVAILYIHVLVLATYPISFASPNRGKEAKCFPQLLKKRSSIINLSSTKFLRMYHRLEGIP